MSLCGRFKALFEHKKKLTTFAAQFIIACDEICVTSTFICCFITIWMRNCKTRTITANFIGKICILKIFWKKSFLVMIELEQKNEGHSPLQSTPLFHLFHLYKRMPWCHLHHKRFYWRGQSPETLNNPHYLYNLNLQ